MKKTTMDPKAQGRPVRYSTPVTAVGVPMPEEDSKSAEGETSSR